ncbi:MAG TPA: hypothetical protein VGG33_25875 [Polyangia bacterium]
MIRHLVLIAAVTGLGAGCASRVHLTQGHGQSVRAAFTSQVANAEAGKAPRRITGLDAQEASIVARNYRRSLVTKGTPTNDDRNGMLFVAPAQPPSQPYIPPPSVPERQ